LVEAEAVVHFFSPKQIPHH